MNSRKRTHEFTRVSSHYACACECVTIMSLNQSDPIQNLQYRYGRLASMPLCASIGLFASLVQMMRPYPPDICSGGGNMKAVWNAHNYGRQSRLVWLHTR